MSLKENFVTHFFLRLGCSHSHPFGGATGSNITAVGGCSYLVFQNPHILKNKVNWVGRNYWKPCDSGARGEPGALEFISGVIWHPIPKDISDPTHGRVLREKFRSVYMVMGVWSFLNNLFLNRVTKFEKKIFALTEVIRSCLPWCHFNHRHRNLQRLENELAGKRLAGFISLIYNVSSNSTYPILSENSKEISYILHYLFPTLQSLQITVSVIEVISGQTAVNSWCQSRYIFPLLCTGTCTL